MRVNIDKNVVVGAGHFGSVFFGTLDGVPIAAKACLNRPSLIREAAFLKLCNHQNVVRYIGVVELVDETYLVMEQALGGTLHQRLGMNQFPDSQKASIVRQMCLGLQHIHSENILHRDIKAENILFKDPNHQVIVIVDFGMAEFYDENSRGGNFHDVVTDETYTFQSDVYLLGILTYQIFRDLHRLERARVRDEVLGAAAGGGLLREIFRKQDWKEAVVRALSPTPANRPSLTSMLDSFRD